MHSKHLAPAAIGLLFLVACNEHQAAAQNPSANNGQAAPVAVTAARPATAALDGITPSDWLHQSSKALLARVLAASSKQALDEAAKTDARAQALAATGYYFGIGGYAKNDAEAARLYRLGAASNPIAQVNYGRMLQDGNAASDGKPSPGAAADYFRMAAEQGHPVAQVNLGILYRDGTGVAQDYNEAAIWFKRAADQGVARAQYELGRLYWTGQGVPKSDAERARLFKLAADQGLADALYDIAWFVDIDHNADAFAAAECAAGPDMSEEDDHEPTAEERAEADKCAKESDNLDKQDPAAPLFKVAFDAYERDAAGGDSYAMTRIGGMYYKGEGVPKDFHAAYLEYSKAANAGDPGGLLNVAIMSERGEGVEGKQEAAAAALYRQLAAKGYGPAEFELARVTESGIGGVTQDKAEALRLYKLAAQHGAQLAKDYLTKARETW